MDAQTVEQLNSFLGKLTFDFAAHSKKFPELQPSAHYQFLSKTLEKEGLIEVEHRAGHTWYKLTLEGHRVLKLPKGFQDYLTEKTAKEQEQKELADAKQAKQEEFWKSGIQRDNRQKWQYWVTTAIATAALLLSIFNFIKSMRPH